MLKGRDTGLKAETAGLSRVEIGGPAEVLRKEDIGGLVTVALVAAELKGRAFFTSRNGIRAGTGVAVGAAGVTGREEAAAGGRVVVATACSEEAGRTGELSESRAPGVSVVTGETG